MRNTQQGFTLIELVVVIVILGILAAVAVPKFVNLQSDARFSVIRGVMGSIQSASGLAHAQIIARNVASGATTVIEGTTVTSAFDYPNAASMQALINLQPTANFTITTSGTALTISPVGVTTAANCQVIYTQPTAAGLPPTITLSPTTQAGCI